MFLNQIKPWHPNYKEYSLQYYSDELFGLFMVFTNIVTIPNEQIRFPHR